MHIFRWGVEDLWVFEEIRGEDRFEYLKYSWHSLEGKTSGEERGDLRSRIMGWQVNCWEGRLGQEQNKVAQRNFSHIQRLVINILDSEHQVKWHPLLPFFQRSSDSKTRRRISVPSQRQPISQQLKAEVVPLKIQNKTGTLWASVLK